MQLWLILTNTNSLAFLVNLAVIAHADSTAKVDYTTCVRPPDAVLLGSRPDGAEDPISRSLLGFPASNLLCRTPAEESCGLAGSCSDTCYTQSLHSHCTVITQSLYSHCKRMTLVYLLHMSRDNRQKC